MQRVVEVPVSQIPAERELGGARDERMFILSGNPVAFRTLYSDYLTQAEQLARPGLFS
jgi:hypothetical protein